jgi:hypothetical protein
LATKMSMYDPDLAGSVIKYPPGFGSVIWIQEKHLRVHNTEIYSASHMKRKLCVFWECTGNGFLFIFTSALISFLDWSALVT